MAGLPLEHDAPLAGGGEALKEAPARPDLVAEEEPPPPDPTLAGDGVAGRPDFDANASEATQVAGARPQRARLAARTPGCDPMTTSARCRWRRRSGAER